MSRLKHSVFRILLLHLGFSGSSNKCGVFRFVVVSPDWLLLHSEDGSPVPR